MNKHILVEAVQDYINMHLHDDVNQIALSKSPFPDVNSAELANQITAKKKSEKKLPTWFSTDNIYYPPALSIEQTSSEATAQYKAGLAIPGKLLDLTGGFGVDSFYFSKVVDEVTHAEINETLSDIAAYNAGVLGRNNIRFEAKDGFAVLTNSKNHYNTIYIDPARRSEKGKVFMLKDCTPDVPSHLPQLLASTDRIIVKTAPLLDLTAGFSELDQVSAVHIVSVKNECKELLWVIDKDFTGSPEIVAVTLNEQIKTFSFFKPEDQADPKLIDECAPGAFIYEPDAALLKSGAFDLIGNRYDLKKLHTQTQLYYSETLKTDFPGRIFRLNELRSTSELKKEKTLSANVIVRNYPAKAEELIRKYKIKSSKDEFLIFTKLTGNRNVVLKSEIVQYY